MQRARVTATAWIVVLVAGWNTTAVCQSPPEPPADHVSGARAVSQGQQALAQYEQGQWPAALEAFQAADALYHSPVFVLYIARCLRNTDRLLAARVAFRRVIVEPIDARAPVPWQRARQDAIAELAALEQEIPSVIVSVGGASPEVSVTVDGRPLRVAQPIELDPGLHRFIAVDGQREQSSNRRLARGERPLRLRLDFPLPLAPSTKRDPSVLGPALTTTGGALALAGGVVGVLAILRADDVHDSLGDQNCLDSVCPISRRASIEQDVDPAVRLGAVSGALLIVGVGMAAAGAVLWLSDGAKDSGPPASPRLSRPLEVRF